MIKSNQQPRGGETILDTGVSLWAYKQRTRSILPRGWERAESPPWQRRGGRASTKCPRSFDRRGRGGSFNLQLIGGLNQPPRLRRLRRLRDIFLLAHPPLLCQGGEFAPS